MSGRVDGPWRRFPLLGALYSERRTPRIVQVVNVSERLAHVQIIRVDNHSNRHTWLRADVLLDEQRWHLLGVTEATPDFAWRSMVRTPS